MLSSKKRSMDEAGVTKPKLQSNSNTIQMDEDDADDFYNEDTKETGSYNYGLSRVPPNCVIVKVNVDGKKDLSGVIPDDCMMISHFIKAAASSIPQKHDKCKVIIVSNKQVKDGITLVEYAVLMQFNADTVFEIQNLAILQHVNPLRCCGRDSIKTYFDKSCDKNCLLMTIASTRNPIKLTESVFIYQHYTSLLMTTDDDESSSKNNFNELSVNRKRAKKSDIRHEKVSDNK